MGIWDDFLGLFSFEGRANRARYFWHIILDDFIIVAAAFWLNMVAGSLAVLPAAGLALGGAWAALAITVRRFHDMDRSGWNCLWFIVPIVNIGVAIWLLFGRGTHGDNRFGADPLARLERYGGGG